MRAPRPLVSIVIPTLGRPDALARAAASALEQAPGGDDVELVVVDNDPAGSAEAATLALRAPGVIPVRYVQAPEPGVANARNAGVAAAHGDFIAFIDDDEIAPPGWLDALLRTQRALDADVVFGPVRARLPDALVEHRRYFQSFFSRTGPTEAGLIESGHGCGNSLVRKAALPHPTEPFCRTRNGTGGEDDLLFAAMQLRGARFAWAPEAWLWEVPEVSRLTLGYTLKRAFAFGQGPCSAAAARGGYGVVIVPVWMAVGLVQFVGHGAGALLAAATRAPMLAAQLDRAARGLGKILWFSPFKIGFYGQGALTRVPDGPACDGATDERHQRVDTAAGAGFRPGQPDLPARAS